MGFDIRKLATDDRLEREGSWVDFAEGVRFKIAHARNDNYQRGLRKLLRERPEFRTAIREGEEISDQAEERFKPETYRLIAEHILVGWEGIEEGGQPVPYSVEKSLEYVTDLRPVREFVIEQANRNANFRRHLQEADLGN